MFSRQKIAMVVAEVVGTATLAVSVYSMVARTSFPLFGGLAAGLVVGLMTVVVGSVTNAHFNPAVTLGLWTARKVKTSTAIVLVASQMLGGVLAWTLLKYLVGRPLESLVQGKFDWKVLVAEGIGAAVFTFGVASAVYQKYEGGKLAGTVGASLLVGILVASMAANGVVNPAVAVGIQSWSWAYAAGPLVGGIVGTQLYALLFAGDFPAVRLTTARPASRTKKAPAKKPASRAKKAPARRR